MFEWVAFHSAVFNAKNILWMERLNFKILTERREGNGRIYFQIDLNPVFVTGAKGEPKTENSGTIMKHELFR